VASDQAAGRDGYVAVQIYDQTYYLSGRAADEAHIRRLAARVDSTMRAVAKQGRTVDSLRVAVLAALNLADELSQVAQVPAAPKHVPAAPPPRVDSRQARARAANLRGLLDEVLADERMTG
jgi:cell division protein ZapA